VAAGDGPVGSGAEARERWWAGVSEPVIHLLNADGEQVGPDIEVGATVLTDPYAGQTFIGWELWSEAEGTIAEGKFQP
jgi:hypothetical protein